MADQTHDYSPPPRDFGSGVAVAVTVIGGILLTLAICGGGAYLLALQRAERPIPAPLPAAVMPPLAADEAEPEATPP